MGGGTYCRFTVGKPGTSAAHLHYVSRPLAVREGRDGALLWQLPEAVTRAESYAALRVNLVAYAACRELLERRADRRCARTHYRTLLSFERDVETARIQTLVRGWLDASFPHARAAGFIHRDRPYTHVHLWLEARQEGGRQLHLDNKAYRTLDEVWNVLYTREMGREPEEHLHKKGEGRGRGPRSQQPSPDREGYRRQEIGRAGADELEKVRTRTDQHPAAGGAAAGHGGKRGAASRERSPAPDRVRVARTVVAARAALSQTRLLRAALDRMATRALFLTRPQPRRTRAEEGRER